MELIPVNGWCACWDGGGKESAVNECSVNIGDEEKNSVPAFSNLFLNTLTEGAVTTGATENAYPIPMNSSAMGAITSVISEGCTEITSEQFIYYGWLGLSLRPFVIRTRMLHFVSSYED